MREKNIPINKFTFLHSIDIISKWVSSLNFFYFYQSKGGIGDDNGQSFKTRIKYTNKDDLIKKLRELNVELEIISSDSPKPIPGQSYTFKEHQSFKKEIKRFPELAQPKNTKALNQNCHIWVFDDYFEISIGGNGTDEEKKYWLVGEFDFDICQALDTKISKTLLVSYIDRKVEEDERFISKTYYLKQLN